MSETVAVALITSSVSVMGTLLGVFLTQYFTNKNENKKRETERNLERLKSKKEKLDPIYRCLIEIINLFPDKTPQDILQYIDYAPNYSSEHFDTVYQILGYQIDDYRKRLANPILEYDVRTEYEIEISNREYYQREINKIRDAYFEAKEKYELFCESEKIDFELYAGQEVKNKLVEFEVVIHNAFISGWLLLEYDDGHGNKLNDARWNLTNSIRLDLDIY